MYIKITRDDCLKLSDIVAFTAAYAHGADAAAYASCSTKLARTMKTAVKRVRDYNSTMNAYNKHFGIELDDTDSNSSMLRNDYLVYAGDVEAVIATLLGWTSCKSPAKRSAITTVTEFIIDALGKECPQFARVVERSRELSIKAQHDFERLSKIY